MSQNFHTNQNRTVFVCKGLLSTAPREWSSANAGKLFVVAPANGDKPYILYNGKKSLMRSGLLQNIEYFKVTTAEQQRRPLYNVEVEMTNNPVAGEIYLLNVLFRQYYDMSDLNNLVKTAATKGLANDTKAKCLARLAASLFKAVNRRKEDVPVKIFLGTTATEVTKAVVKTIENGTYSGTATKIIIKENYDASQFDLGATWNRPLYFDVVCGSYETDEKWGTAKVVLNKTTSGNYVGNGEACANLEYFSMKERGDIYGKKCFPNYVKTDYFIGNEGIGNEYDVIDIHYSYIGQGVAFGTKSERDIQIICAAGQGTTIADKIKDATGLQYVIADNVTSTEEGGTDEPGEKAEE